MRALMSVVGLMVALAAGACTPEAIRPLPEDRRVLPDQRLVGTWKAQVLGNEHVAVISPGDVGRLVAVLSSRAAAGGGPPVETRHELSFYDLDGTRIIVERGPGFVDRRPVYRFAAYDVGADGRVTLRFASENEIKHWALPLKIPSDIRSRDPFFYDILLTTSAEATAALLATKAQAEMFNVPFGPFTRQ